MTSEERSFNDAQLNNLYPTATRMPSRVIDSSRRPVASRLAGADIVALSSPIHDGMQSNFIDEVKALGQQVRHFASHLNFPYQAVDRSSPSMNSMRHSSPTSDVRRSKVSSGFSTPTPASLREMFSEPGGSSNSRDLEAQTWTSRLPPTYQCPQCKLSSGIIFEAGTRRIARLVKNTPVQLQGILAEGDEIVELNGRECDSKGLNRYLKCTGNLFGSTVQVTVARWNSFEHTMDHFATRLFLTPEHEVLAKDLLQQSLQELSSPAMTNHLVHTNAGVGLVLGMDSSGEPYVERVVERSPAMQCGIIERYDVLYSIDGFVVRGKRVEYISSLLTGGEDSVCHLVLLRGSERKSVQVSLKRALPAGAVRRPSIKDIALQLDRMERTRLAEITKFLQNFSAWHTEVNNWISRTVRGLKPAGSESRTPTGKLNVIACRGNLLASIRTESMCEQMLQTLKRRQVLASVELWSQWSFHQQKLRLLLKKFVCWVNRRCQQSFFVRFLNNATARRLYRRQVSKAVVYGRLVHKKMGFGVFIMHTFFVSENRKQARRISSALLYKSRVKQFRTLNAWLCVIKTSQAINRVHAITLHKLERRKLLCAMDSWCFRAMHRKQLVKRGIWLLTNNNHNCMQTAFYKFKKHSVNRRQARSNAVRKCKARAFRALQLVQLENQAGVLPDKVRFHEARKEPLKSLRIWISKSTMKRQQETCSRVFWKWNRCKNLSVRTFVQISRFQGRRSLMQTSNLLAQWLRYARRSKKLRRRFFQVMQHKRYFLWSSAFVGWYSSVSQERRSTALQKELEVCKAELVSCKHDLETVHRLQENLTSQKAEEVLELSKLTRLKQWQSADEKSPQAGVQAKGSVSVLDAATQKTAATRDVKIQQPTTSKSMAPQSVLHQGMPHLAGTVEEGNSRSAPGQSQAETKVSSSARSRQPVMNRGSTMALFGHPIIGSPGPQQSAHFSVPRYVSPLPSPYGSPQPQHGMHASSSEPTRRYHLVRMSPNPLQKQVREGGGER